MPLDPPAAALDEATADEPARPRGPAAPDALLAPELLPAGNTSSRGTGAEFGIASAGNERARSSPLTAPAPAALPQTSPPGRRPPREGPDAAPADAAGSSAVTILRIEAANACGTSTSAAVRAAHRFAAVRCVLVSSIINSARSLSENERKRSSSAMTFDTTFRCANFFKGSDAILFRDGSKDASLQKQCPDRNRGNEWLDSSLRVSFACRLIRSPKYAAKTVLMDFTTNNHARIFSLRR